MPKVCSAATCNPYTLSIGGRGEGGGGAAGGKGGREGGFGLLGGLGLTSLRLDGL